jgi:hypothetical protein
VTNFGIRSASAVENLARMKTLILGARKNWAGDWAIVGDLLFNFLVKQIFRNVF